MQRFSRAVLSLHARLAVCAAKLRQTLAGSVTSKHSSGCGKILLLGVQGVVGAAKGPTAIHEPSPFRI